jgi:hypothetical protein
MRNYKDTDNVPKADFYMDDWKKRKNYKTAKTFSDDINIVFRFYRCTHTAPTKGKSIHTQNLILNIKRKYRNLNGKKHTGTQRLNEVQVNTNK